MDLHLIAPGVVGRNKFLALVCRIYPLDCANRLTVQKTIDNKLDQHMNASLFRDDIPTDVFRQRREPYILWCRDSQALLERGLRFLRAIQLCLQLPPDKYQHYRSTSLDGIEPVVTIKPFLQAALKNPD